MTYINTNKEFYESYNSSNQTFTTVITVNVNTVRENSGVFTNTSGEITFNKDMFIMVNYRFSTEVNSGTARSSSRGFLELNSGSGFVLYPGTATYMYNRITGPGQASGSGSVLMRVSQGDIIRMRVIRHAGTDSLRTIGGGCGLSILEILEVN